MSAKEEFLSILFVVLSSIACLPPSYSQRPALTGNPGWFLDDWQPRTFSTPKKSNAVICPSGDASVTAELDLSTPLTRISKYIFGNNLGIWVNRANLENEEFVLPIQDMGTSIIRYPGGNASNDFFWSAADVSDCPLGVPDTIWKNNGRYTPPKLGYEGNFKFSPEHYYQLLLRTGATGSICINYSFALYGEIADEDERVQLAAAYAADWVRDANIKRNLGIKFWEIGNENWGPWQAGYNVPERGQIDPAKYGRHCRVFIEAMKSVDPSIKIGVVGYQKPKTNNPVQSEWNAKVLPEILGHADYYVLHDYFTDFKAILSPEQMFASVDTAYSHIQVVNDALEKLDGTGANAIPIALTEFNTRSRATISANDGATNVSHSAGLFISHALGEFIRQGYGSAMMWDLVNGYSDGEDHGVFSSPKEYDVPELTPHPSFYHYYLYNKCFGDTYFDVRTNNDQVRIHASSFSSGEVGLVILNGSPKSHKVSINVKNDEAFDTAYQFEVYNENPLSRKTFVNGMTGPYVAGGPEKYWKVPANKWTLSDSLLLIDSPPFSANYIVLD